MEMTVAVCDNGNPPKTWVAQIKHKFIDGCHVLTSEKIDGFFLSSRNAAELQRQIVPTIERLLKLNEGLDCSVEIVDEFAGSESHSAIAHPASGRVMQDAWAVIRRAA